MKLSNSINCDCDIYLNNKIKNIRNKCNKLYKEIYNNLSKIYYANKIKQECYTDLLPQGYFGLPKNHEYQALFKNNHIACLPLTAKTPLNEAKTCYILEFDISHYKKLCQANITGLHITPLILQDENYQEFKHNAKSLFNNQEKLNNLIQQHSELIQAPIRNYSIMQNKDKKLSIMVNNTNSGKYLCNLELGEPICTAMAISHDFKCPKPQYPLLFLGIGTASSPCIAELIKRCNDAKKHNIKCAPTLVVLGYKDKNSEYGLNIIQNLAADPKNNIELIITHGKNHIFPKANEVMEFGTDIMHDKEHFEKISKFIHMKHIHIRIAGYQGMDEQFKNSAMHMARQLDKKQGEKLAYRFNQIESQQRLRAEGAAIKNTQNTRHGI